MIRLLLSLPVILIVAGIGTIYHAYGEVDPCRVLAVERARRAENETGIPIGGMVEPLTRMQTSQLSTGQCSHELADSWMERLKAAL